MGGPLCFRAGAPSGSAGEPVGGSSLRWPRSGHPEAPLLRQPVGAGHEKRAVAALAVLVTAVGAGGGGHKGTDATVGELVEQ